MAWAELLPSGSVPGIGLSRARAATPPGQPSAATTKWVPPLAPPLRITGSFGEYRRGHVHAGVDFSTGGVTGMPVRAVAGGSIVRLRAGAGGYGRALYLQTREGHLAVYGHLDRFHPVLEDSLRRAQRAQGEYEIDLYPKAGRFTFAAGETIAWSGATGAGPPHLHFELREGEDPVNPLDLGLRVPDLLAPAIGSVRLRALAPSAYVNGGSAATISTADAQAPRVWGPVGVECWVVDRSGTTDARLAPKAIDLFVDGAIVFRREFRRVDLGRSGEVDCIYGSLRDAPGSWGYRLYDWPRGVPTDQDSAAAGGGWIDFSLLPAGRHRLCIEARDAAGNVAERAWEVMVAPPLRVERWRAARDGESGWLLGLRLGAPLDTTRLELKLAWTGGKGAGEAPWLPLGEGWFCSRVPEAASLEIRDRQGHPLLPEMRIGQRAGADSTKAPRVSLQFDEGFLGFEIFPAVPPAAPLTATLERGDGGTIALPLRGRGPEGGWLFAAALTQAEGRWERLWVGTAGRAKGRAIALRGLVGASGPSRRHDQDAQACSLEAGLTLRFGPDSFFGPVFLQAMVERPGGSFWDACVDPAGRMRPPSGHSGMPELSPDSPILCLGPEWWPFAGPVDLRADERWLPARGDSLAVTRGLYQRRDDGGWRWIAPVGSAGGLETSLAGPGCYAVMIDGEAPRIRAGHPHMNAVLAGRPERLQASVEEAGSGFAPQEADIYLDGRPLLAVWDIDEGLLSAEVDAPLAPGSHRWEVRVKDRAGNTGSERFDFVVSGR